MKHSLVQNTIRILVCLSIGLLMPQTLSLADHGFSDALALSYQQDTKCALPAYDARYYYFSGASASNSPASVSNTVISITPLGKYRVTLYDSHGTILPLSKSGTNYTYMQSADAGQRYFLCVQNQSSKNLALSIALHETSASYNKGSTPTPAAKAKKQSPKSPSRTAAPKKSSKSASSTAKSKKAARSGSSSTRSGKSSGADSSSARLSKSSGAGSSSARSSKSSGADSSSARPSNSSGAGSSPSPSHANRSSKNSMSSKSSTPQQSKATSPTASPTVISHFVRIKEGTSLAIVERIIQDPPTTAFSIEASSPDVSITNGILYVPKTGLYYLTLQSKTITTTCTLCVY